LSDISTSFCRGVRNRDVHDRAERPRARHCPNCLGGSLRRTFRIEHPPLEDNRRRALVPREGDAGDTELSELRDKLLAEAKLAVRGVEQQDRHRHVRSFKDEE
jgi:hypothetical protein